MFSPWMMVLAGVVLLALIAFAATWLFKGIVIIGVAVVAYYGIHTLVMYLKEGI